MVDIVITTIWLSGRTSRSVKNSFQRLDVGLSVGLEAIGRLIGGSGVRSPCFRFVATLACKM